MDCRKMITCAAVVACGLITQGCMFPSGTLVLSDDGSEVGWNDVTDSYENRYLAVAASNEALGSRFGSARHDHDVSHNHDVRLAGATETMRPYGAEAPTAKAGHIHRVRGDRQSVGLTSVPNLPPRVGFSVLKPGPFVSKVPAGTLAFFIGSVVPDGWEPVKLMAGPGGTERCFIRIGVRPHTDIRGHWEHAHGSMEHGHEFNVARADDTGLGNVQMFTNWSEGDPAPAVAHGHRVTKSDGVSRGVSHGVSASRPAFSHVELCLVRSTRELSRLPTGIAFFTTRSAAPGGWKLVRPGHLANDSEDPHWFVMPIETHAESPIWTAGTRAMHSHETEHTHSVGTIPTQSNPVGLIWSGEAEKVALHTHSHLFRPTLSVASSADAAMPESVSLNLIVKVR